jgi:hypothetical protein
MSTKSVFHILRITTKSLSTPKAVKEQEIPVVNGPHKLGVGASRQPLLQRLITVKSKLGFVHSSCQNRIGRDPPIGRFSMLHGPG